MAPEHDNSPARTTTSQDPGDAARIWADQARWSQAANRAKGRIAAARLTALLCGLAFAALGTAAALVMDDHPGAGRAMAFAAAVSAGCATLAGQWTTPERIRDWTRLRSVSEALKSEVYGYLAAPSEERLRQLAARTDDVLADAGDLDRYVAGRSVPGGRALPAVDGLASYMELRVRAQIDGYYRPRAELYRRRLAVVRAAELVFGLMSVVLAAWSGTFESAGAGRWLAVAATAGMAVSAHAAAANYDYQELEFSRTAQELERVWSRWRREPPADAESRARLVAHAEHVISIQNEAWMVKWQEAGSPGQPGPGGTQPAG
ncbi:DUF4231 domain-containing protein [Streptomyces glaucescens]|uniref:DUF4231 domain-containing protein n=1 Tax=Streptomyces glaucescens TaxID=1907 RepID=UPI00344DE53E